MNTDYLEEFITLSQCTSFTEAAKKLSISQSKLSKHIAKLEEETGVKLITRTSPIGLTNAGRIFFDGSQLILNELKETIERSRVVGQSPAGEVLIQSYPHDNAMRQVLMRTTDIFNYKHPTIKVSVVDVRDRSGIHGLETDAADIDFYFAYSDTDSTAAYLSEMGIGSIPIARSFNTIAMRNDNPLAKKDVISVADLANTPIMFNTLGVSSESLREALSTMCTEAGFDPLFSTFSLSHASEFLMLDPGLAVYILPNSTQIESLKARPSITVRPFDCANGDHTFIGFFIYKLESDNPSLSYFVNALRDEAQAISREKEGSAL